MRSWTPIRVRIREQNQADNGSAKAVGDPVMVLIQAARQISVALGLDLDVDHHPFGLAIPPLDLHELVGALFAQVSVAHDLLELLVEKLDGHSPIYSSRSERKA